MKTVTLTRDDYGPADTYGILELDGLFWQTIERSKADPVHPCIPAGTYPLRLSMHHYGKPDAYPCYWVDNVPGRTAIEIHVANVAQQLEGCIAPGDMRGLTKGVPGLADGLRAVFGSHDAFQQFMRMMDGEPGQLIVRDQDDGA